MQTFKKWGCIAAAAVLMCSLLAGCGDDDASSTATFTPPTGVGDTGAPQSSAASAAASSVSIASEPSSDSASSSASESELGPQPAPEFVDGGPSISVDGTTVTVTFKTNVESTVNSILATSGSAISVSQFYDYFNRNMALNGAVSKQQTYSVDESGRSVTYQLPDIGHTYYLLLNAAENATGTWQSSVTVVQVFVPSATIPAYAGSINRGTDTSSTAVFTAELSLPSTLYCIVTPRSDAAPTTQQILDGGSGYTGTIIAVGNAATATTAPHTVQLEVPNTSLAQGDYTAWFVAKNAQDTSAPLSALGVCQFTV